MKSKNPGVTANGPARPESMNGDIYRDKYGGAIMIRGVTERRITYHREGYGYDCVIPVYQLRHDFSLVQAAPRNRPTSREKTCTNIQEVKKMLNVLKGKK